jgi:ketosteroid isomerase-like protein
MTDEAREFAASRSRSTWGRPGVEYAAVRKEGVVASHTPDAITMPANHTALRGHDAIAEWYRQRANGYTMHVQTDVDTVDIVGDLAVSVATFRVTRHPEEGAAGVDHAGRWLAVWKREGGAWRLWRDMDTNSPDGDHWYTMVRRDAR